MLEQVLHEMVESLKADCTLGMGDVPHWGMFPPAKGVGGAILCALAPVECRRAQACERPPATTTGTSDYRILHVTGIYYLAPDIE